MTVTTDTNRVSYAGNGTTSPWAFTFPISAASDLKVMARTAAGVESTLVIATDYTVSAPPFTSGGAVTPLANTVAGTTYTLIGNVPVTQAVALLDGGPLPAGTVNNALDRLTMISRRLKDRADRSLSLRDTDVSGSGQFDAMSNEIINLDDGTLGSSAATVQQLATAIAAGFVGPAGTVTAYQMLQALVDTANPSGTNLVPAMTNVLYEDMRDAQSRQWFSRRPLSPGSTLAATIQSTAGWSAGQMTTFFTLAASKPV